MPIELTDGAHTPSGTTAEVAATFSAPGAYWLLVDLAQLDTGDDVTIALSAQATSSASRLVQEQSFADDVGLAAAEFSFVISDDAEDVDLVVTQPTGTPRTFGWCARRIHES